MRRRGADACAPSDSSALANSRVVRRGDHRVDRGARRRRLRRSSRRSSRAGCSSTASRCSTGSRPRRHDAAGSITLSGGAEVPPALGPLAGRAAVGHAGAGVDLAGAGDRSGRRRSRPATCTRWRPASGDRPDRDLLHEPRLRRRARPRAPTPTSTSTTTSRRPARRRSTCPAATAPRIRRDLGGRDGSVVHRGLHVLRRRQRHRDR